VGVKYVHEDFILGERDTAGEKYKRGPKKGKRKDPKKYKAYDKLYNDSYLPMREKVLSYTFDLEDVTSFEDCANTLNEYWQILKKFIEDNKLGNNTKLHTNFLEEFSCYFLKNLNSIEQYDIFVKDVFAGLKIQSDFSITQINKDVDFCIGKQIVMPIDDGEQLILNVPAVSVEVKSYVDATMLGEIMNTSRKIKGANPGSKAILLTWINSFADEHALEAAYDSAIDEIVVLSEYKRKQGEPVTIEFNAQGLLDYYYVMDRALRETQMDNGIPAMGRIISYVKHLSKE